MTNVTECRMIQMGSFFLHRGHSTTPRSPLLASKFKLEHINENIKIPFSLHKFTHVSCSNVHRLTNEGNAIHRILWSPKMKASNHCIATKNIFLKNVALPMSSRTKLNRLAIFEWLFAWEIELLGPYKNYCSWNIAALSMLSQTKLNRLPIFAWRFCLCEAEWLECLVLF